MGDWNFENPFFVTDEENDVFFEPPSYRIFGESCDNCCSSQTKVCSRSGVCNFYRDSRYSGDYD